MCQSPAVVVYNSKFIFNILTSSHNMKLMCGKLNSKLRVKWVLLCILWDLLQMGTWLDWRSVCAGWSMALCRVVVSVPRGLQFKGLVILSCTALCTTWQSTLSEGQEKIYDSKIYLEDMIVTLVSVYTTLSQLPTLWDNLVKMDLLTLPIPSIKMDIYCPAPFTGLCVHGIASLLGAVLWLVLMLCWAGLDPGWSGSWGCIAWGFPISKY